MMDKDRSQITDRILNLTLEIISLLTGEDYTVVKKTSGERVTPSSRPRVSGGWSRTPSPITLPPPHSLIHESNNEQKILELTNKIIQLLTGEGEDLIDIKVKIIEEEEETYVRGDERCKEEEIPTDISPADGHNSGNTSEGHLLLSRDCEIEDNDITQDSPGENPITPNIPPVPHIADISADPSNHQESSPDTSDIVTHSTAQRGDKMVPCYDCGKLFRRKGHLIAHQRIHMGKKFFPCSECGKRFKHKCHLVRHQKIHTGEKPFACSKCGKCFVQNSDLIRHQKCHTVEKPFSCSECGKCFKSRSNLVTHQRTHTGGKSFQCSECGKCFSKKPTLVKHYRIHTGDKPFSCLECGRRFSQKSFLSKHLSIHTGSKLFSCSECGKCFTSKSYLVIHERFHAEEKPFSCSRCGKRFALKLFLVDHQRTHTGEGP